MNRNLTVPAFVQAQSTTATVTPESSQAPVSRQSTPQRLPDLVVLEVMQGIGQAFDAIETKMRATPRGQSASTFLNPDFCGQLKKIQNRLQLLEEHFGALRLKSLSQPHVQMETHSFESAYRVLDLFYKMTINYQNLADLFEKLSYLDVTTPSKEALIRANDEFKALMKENFCHSMQALDQLSFELRYELQTLNQWDQWGVIKARLEGELNHFEQGFGHLLTPLRWLMSLDSFIHFHNENPSQGTTTKIRQMAQYLVLQGENFAPLVSSQVEQFFANGSKTQEEGLQLVAKLHQQLFTYRFQHKDSLKISNSSLHGRV